MWSRSVSQLDHDLPLEARRRRRFPEKYQGPLSDREKEIVQVIKSLCGEKDLFFFFSIAIRTQKCALFSVLYYVPSSLLHLRP